LFQRFEWHKFEPHPEWAAWDVGANDVDLAWGKWIWFPEGEPQKDAPAERRLFRKAIDVPADRTVKKAIAYLTADDRFVVFVNGKQIGASAESNDAWRHPRRLDLAPHLRTGRNVLAVEAENAAANVPANPAGLICAGEIVFDDGTKLRVASNETWKTAKPQAAGAWTQVDFDDAAWAGAKAVARYGQVPWGDFSLNDTAFAPLAAGIAGQVRVIYLPHPTPVRVVGLERAVQWQAEHFDPVTGQTADLGRAVPDANGTFRMAPPPAASEDWVLVLRRR
jgi:hypothetical protein